MLAFILAFLAAAASMVIASDTPNPILCGAFATGNYDTATAIMNNLQDNGNTEVSVPPHSCYRVACAADTAVYLCNDDSQPLLQLYTNIAAAIFDIRMKCCPNSRVTPPTHALSGQLFSPDDNHINNIVVAYGNCGDDPFTIPSSYPLWGPNGKCF